MAAITGTVVNPVNLNINASSEITYTAATNPGNLVTDTETFDIALDKDDKGSVLVINNQSGAAVKYTILKGDMFAACRDLPEVTVPTGKMHVITVDSARYKLSNGKIKVKVTPTAGTALNASGKVNLAYINA